MRRSWVTVAGVVLALLGLLWFLQGVGVIGGSFMSGVRREALCCIPRAAGTDSEGGSWVARLTWRGNLKGTRACRGSGGRLEASRPGCRKARTIWPRLDCLKPNLQW